ncbi:astakine-like [Palaemon carinicauda]|uniref:astakine-like n=1 Tax=Palaemon carinicauda TaxID=392227 RepID=UPI0035B5860B
MGICRKMLSVMAAIVIGVIWMDRQTYALPPEFECSTSDDCPWNGCCLVGFERFSLPKCVIRGNVGDWCRIDSSPMPMKLGYPNGIVAKLEAVHLGFCNCLPGLFCARNTSKCDHPELTDADNIIES